MQHAMAGDLKSFWTAPGKKVTNLQLTVTVVMALVLFRLRKRKMFFSPEIRELFRRQETVQPTTSGQFQQRYVKEQELREKGVATCLHCKEEIRYNESSAQGGWFWESEYLLGWCDAAPRQKHEPEIVIEEEEEDG